MMKAGGIGFRRFCSSGSLCEAEIVTMTDVTEIFGRIDIFIFELDINCAELL